MIHVAEPTPRVCWVARTSALWPDTILAARCAGRCEDDGIIGIVGGDLVEVARGERSGPSAAGRIVCITYFQDWKGIGDAAYRQRFLGHHSKRGRHRTGCCRGPRSGDRE